MHDPPGIQFLSLSCSFWQKKLKNNSSFGSWRPLPGEILDLPLASHCSGLSPGCCLGLTLCHTWDVFHPSQPMPAGFPLGVFFHPQKGSKLFQLKASHKNAELVLGDVKNGFTCTHLGRQHGTMNGP